MVLAFEEHRRRAGRARSAGFTTTPSRSRNGAGCPALIRLAKTPVGQIGAQQHTRDELGFRRGVLVENGVVGVLGLLKQGGAASAGLAQGGHSQRGQLGGRRPS